MYEIKNTYEFKYVKENTFKLIYTNKKGEKVEKQFVRDVEIAKRLQQIQAKARLKMLAELTKLGMTKEDLVIRKEVEKGKVVYDETNYKENEKVFIEIESLNTIDEIFKDYLGLGIVDLLSDMGMDINSDKQEDALFVELFTKKFITIITGNQEAVEEKQPS